MTSPTLTLRVRSPEALQQFKELAAAARTLREELAALQVNQAGGAKAGITRLEAEVRELRAGLQASRMEVENLQRALEQQAQRSAALIAREKEAVKEKGRVEREEVRKTAEAKKRAEQEALGARASLGRLPLTNGLVVPLGEIRAGSPEKELQQIADVQLMLTRKLNADMAVLNEAGHRQIQYQQVKANERLQQLNLEGGRAIEYLRAKQQERLQEINFAGQRQIEYQQIKANERLQELNLVGGRQMELQKLRHQEQMRELNMAGYRQAEVQQERANERLRAINLAGLRQIELDRRAALMTQMQALHADPRVVLGLGPAAALAGAPRSAAESAFNQLGDTASLNALYRAHHKVAEGAAENAANTAKLTEQQQLMRSTMRGVSGAMGGLWLTYSRFLVPMFAGFAAARTVMESFRQGLQFDYTTAFTAALNDEALAKGPQALEAYKVKLQKDVMEIAGSTRFSANELATGLRVMEQTGIDAAKGVNLIKTAANAAVVGETDLKTATQDLIGVMEVFKFRTNDPIQLQKNFERVADVLAYVAKETKANLHDVAQSMQNVVGVAGQFNVKLETAAVVVEQLGRAGIVGAKAGTYARNFFDNLYNDASQKAKQLKETLGITPFDEKGNLKEDTAFLLDALQRIKSLNLKEQLFSVSTLYNIRSARAARELLSVFDQIPDRLAKLQNTKGTLDQITEAINKVTQVQLEMAKARGADLLTKAFEGAASAVQSLAKALQDTFKDPQVISGVAAMVQMVAGLGRVLMMVVEGWVRIAGVVAQASDAPQRLRSQILKHRVVANRAQQNIDEGIDVARSTRIRNRSLATIDKLKEQLDNDPSARAQALAEKLAAEKKKSDAELAAAVAATAGPTLEQAGRQAADRLPKSLTDPKRYAEQQALQRALSSDADAEFKREYQRIQQKTRFEVEATEAAHRYNLISEEAYQNKIEELNKRRIQEAIDAELRGVARLEEVKKKLDKPADRQQVDIRIKGQRARVEELQREAEHVDAMVELRKKGDAKVRTEAAAAAVQGYRADLAKLVEQQELSRVRASQQIESRLLPGAEAAKKEAQLATEAAFLSQTEKLKKEIAQLDEKTDLKSRDRAAALRTLVSVLEDQKKVQTELNEKAAEANYLRQREFSYGWSQAFREYEENAMNSAQHARDVFTANVNGMTSAIINFAKTGKFSIRDWSLTVIDALLKIQAQEAATKILRGVQSLIPGFSIGGGGSLAPAQVGGGFQVPINANVGHTGGIVGLLTASRGVSASLFYGAPRMHGGGLVGGEVPVIAKKGEGIFTPEQMRHLAPAGSNVNISVTVNAETGATDVSGGGAENMKQLGELIAARAREEIVRQQRPGGLLATVR